MSALLLQQQQPQYASKWVTFAASAVLQACSGLAYSFSVYAPTIKEALDLSQTQIAAVGSTVNLGGYLAIVSGSLYDAAKEHHKLGPRLVVWLGCVCCFGYLGMYLMVAGHTPHSFTQLLVFAAAAGNMGTWFDTCALVTSMRNFPTERGFVVGVLKSFLGLSSSIFTSIYACAFEPDATQFLLMLALVPSLVGLAASFGINYVPWVEASETCHAATKRRFLLSFLGVGGLALYQMASAVVQAVHPFGEAGKAAIVGGMVALLALSTLLPVAAGGWCWRAVYAHPYIHTRESVCDDENECSSGGAWQQQNSQQPAASSRHGDSPQARRVGVLPCFTTVPHQRVGQLRTFKEAAGPSAQHGASSTSAGAREGRPSNSGSSTQRHHSPAEDAGEAAPLLATNASSSKALAAAAPVLEALQQHEPAALLPSLGPKQMLASLNFWLLFLQFTVASGVCLAYLNNLGALVVALGGRPGDQVVFVSLFSVANAGGRLAMGAVPESALHARGTPRTLFLALTAAALAAAALANAYASLGGQYVISLALGAAFGAHWSLLPAITSDLFGLKHFAANYTTLQFAPAGGSYLLATRLTGWLYDRAADEHGDAHHQCIGPDCFSVAFKVLAGLAALSAVACVVVTSRSRRTYASMCQHLRQVDTSADGGTRPSDHQ